MSFPRDIWGTNAPVARPSGAKGNPDSYTDNLDVDVLTMGAGFEGYIYSTFESLAISARSTKLAKTSVAFGIGTVIPALVLIRRSPCTSTPFPRCTRAGRGAVPILAGPSGENTSIMLTSSGCPEGFLIRNPRC